MRVALSLAGVLETVRELGDERQAPGTGHRDGEPVAFGSDHGPRTTDHGSGVRG
jgi:hypothetical protein